MIVEIDRNGNIATVFYTVIRKHINYYMIAASDALFCLVFIYRMFFLAYGFGFMFVI